METVQILPDTVSITSKSILIDDKEVLEIETANNVTSGGGFEKTIHDEVQDAKAQLVNKSNLQGFQEPLEGLYYYLIRSFNTELSHLAQKRLTNITSSYLGDTSIGEIVGDFLKTTLQFPDETTPATAERFIIDISEALWHGDALKARRLSIDGTQRYPNHNSLQKYARILAPPKVTRSDLPPTPSIRANRNWLRNHSKDYKGRWIALEDGKLVGVAGSFNELVEQLSDTSGVLLTKIN